MLNGKEGRLLRRNNDKDANMKINILLCDDDKDFLQRISDTVAGQSVPPGASICITKSSNPAEITDRQLSQYHIMFLDIDMDERSGMDIARRVRELHLDTVIIFVTNYPEFSMEGYEVRAFRYLLKQELEQKLPNYFRDALAELPRDDKVLHFSANAESFNISLQSKQNERILLVNTHHAALDALLNQKALVAKNRKIDIQFSVNDLSPIKIDMVDLTVVISNTLDNAIEACEKLPETDRQIYVQALLEEDELFYAVRNKSLPVNMIANQLPASTKENPSFHGYGLQNVHTTLEKYHTLYAMDYENGWFEFATELPNTLIS